MGRAEFLSPMLAQPVEAPPEAQLRSLLAAYRSGWLFEAKLDGLRAVAVRNGPDVGIWSRNSLSFNARFPAVVRAVAALPVDNLVLDGEIVGVVDGRPDFGALQRGTGTPVEYHVFDLPWLLGRDLRALAIEERKQLLARFVPPDGPVRRVPVLEGEPFDLLEDLCRLGWEGMMAKRGGSAYVGSRSADWRKLKCACRQELVIGGYTEPQRSRAGFGALLLGHWADGRLVYAGKVGTGFTDALLADMYRQLLALESPVAPFSALVRERGAHWVEPVLVAEISFSNWTADGRLRHPSFVGLRPDKDASEVRREPCGPRPHVGQRR
jgi:DNA ligase D-like protein (predicted ligase)